MPVPSQRSIPRLRTASRLLLLGVAAALIPACGGEPEPPPPWHQEDGYRWRELRVEGQPTPGFEDLDPSHTGVEFVNRLSQEQELANDLLLMGSGVALGDVDGDGRTDIYLTRLQGPNALYLNQGGWEFREAAARAGVRAEGQFSTGAALADVDGDGDLDLLVAALDGATRLFLNGGDGTFTPDGDQPALDTIRAGTTMTLADVDGDGDLDLYQATHRSERLGDAFMGRGRRIERLVVGEGDSAVIAPEYREFLRMEVRDGERVPVEYAETDWLLLNDGTGRFRAASWTEGRFLDRDGEPLEERPDDFGLAARFHDVDGDGDPDLYVCNDFEDPDQFWLNQGDGTFRQAPWFALRATSQASMSVDFSDVDRDGRVDIFVTDMLSSERAERLRRRPLHSLSENAPGEVKSRPQFQRNTLFWNRGDGTFAQIAELAGVEATEWTWGSLFLDVDLDGYEDILAANGHLRDGRNADVTDTISALADQLTWREAKTYYPPHKTRNAAFRNEGTLTFEPAGERWDFGPEPDVSHGVATGDLDGDGDQDVVVNRLRSHALVLRNRSSRPRLAVRLRSEDGNTRGIGATVRVEGGGVVSQEKEMTAGGLYDSSPEPLLTFAAGDADSLRIEVRWPGGGVSVVDPARPDRLYEIRRSGTGNADGPGSLAGGSDERATDAEDVAPYFEDVSHRLDHVHPESSFTDFRRQPLLPNRLSRMGPGVSWADVDGDGDPDLVVTPGTGGPTTYLENTGSGFRRRVLDPDAAALDRTAALLVPGRSSALSLAVGQSIFESASPGEARELPGVLTYPTKPTSSRAPSRGEGEPTGAAHAPASTLEGVTTGRLNAVGPLSQADVDGDGDLDLFVGGRTVPGFYPLAASSMLLINEGERFRRAPETEQLFTDVGLVSASLFSDVDGDGDPDLLLALEWGPIRLFRNDGGRFTEATAEWGLSDLEGRWNALGAGDFDEDGRMDLVATGWGRNMRLRPEPGRPLLLYHGDLGGRRQWHGLIAQRERDGEEIYPLERFERFRRALPETARRIGSFTRYSELTVEEVIPQPMSQVRRLRATTYRHHLLLNRGDHFEPVPLPTRAQFAPSFGLAVADFDGDGHEDLFLSQNFFPVSPFVPRHDAGTGLWLRGDGTGELEPVPSSMSGIRAWGDARAAASADFDGDGRVDLAVGQNGYQTKLFRNVRAEPGLRVRLAGPPGNPDAVGATIRVDYGDHRGPAREIHSGSGHWSSDSPVQVLGLSGEPVAVLVRWPDGAETRSPLEPGRREITVEHPG